MKINIQNLRDGIYTYDFIPDIVELDLGHEDIFKQPIQVQSTVDKRARNIVVTSRIRTPGNFQCDCCLAEFAVDIQDDFSILYTSEQNLVDADEDDSVQLLTSMTHEIDLTAGLRDALLLTIPMKIKCSEDCKGLCPHCGTNLNERQCDCRPSTIDPRWEGLRKLVG